MKSITTDSNNIHYVCGYHPDLLADQAVPAERSKQEGAGHPRGPLEGKLDPTLPPLPVKPGEGTDVRFPQLQVLRGKHHAAGFVDPEDQGRVAAHERAGIGHRGPFDRLDVLRAPGQLVGDEEVPLVVHVVLEVLGLEGQELHGHAGDPVARGERGRQSAQDQGGHQEREHYQDHLDADAHRKSVPRLRVFRGVWHTRAHVVYLLLADAAASRYNPTHEAGMDPNQPAEPFGIEEEREVSEDEIHQA